jgi:APA family basic amino acid/polyamine antiporter
MPDAPRSYKTWGYPVVPAIFIAASAFLLYSSFAANLEHSTIGLAVILAGIPVFMFFRRRSESRA